MIWQVEWTVPASKDMRSLDGQAAGRIRAGVLRLADTGQGDVLKLQGHSQEWWLRVGDYRVRFAFDRQAQVIRVLRVRHRRESYRG